MKLSFLLIKKKFTRKSPTWKRRKDFTKGSQARLLPPKKLKMMHHSKAPIPPKKLRMMHHSKAPIPPKELGMMQHSKAPSFTLLPNFTLIPST